MNLYFQLYILLISSHGIFAKWLYPTSYLEEGDPKRTVNRLIQAVDSSEDVAEYQLSGPGVSEIDYKDDSPQGWTVKFMIVQDTGLVYQIAHVDFEKYQEYKLTTIGLDANGKVVEPGGPLVIIITDINDNSPVFEPSSLNGKVEEANGGSSYFMILKATDADSLEQNKDVYFYVEAGSDVPTSVGGQRFRVNKDTGEVFVNGELDYEKDQTVKFNVIATNEKDGPPADDQPHSIATVTIQVEDSNDHAPVVNIEKVKSVSELTIVGKPFYKITAYDADSGVNKMVYFEIQSGNVGDKFEIVSKPSDTTDSIGYLQLKEELDYEQLDNYELEIKAYNKDAENFIVLDYAAISKLQIKVIDENEAPVFQDTPYDMYVTEVFGDTKKLPENVPTTVKLLAKDYDFGFNQTVTYSVDDPEGWFGVNKESGQIYQISEIDREQGSVVNGIYQLAVIATDNYDHKTPASRNGVVSVHIADVNDNDPKTKLSPDDLNAAVCEKPTNKTVILLEATDPDSPKNGPPFTFRLDPSVDSQLWGLVYVSESSSKVVAKFSDYDMGSSMETVDIPFTISDNGSPPRKMTSTLTATICGCDDEGKSKCAETLGGAGLTVPVIIAIIAILLLLLILLLALVAYKRRQDALVLKEPFFDDEDDVRENVQVYQEEGGEEDQDAYDLSALRAPLLEDPSQPVRKEVPLQQAPREPRGVPDDIGDYIGDAKDQADADPSAPPFDSLLVFDYEGAGSDAGSLSSINTATTDGSMDYDYLNNWGPRFSKLADMYNDGSDSE